MTETRALRLLVVSPNNNPPFQELFVTGNTTTSSLWCPMRRGRLRTPPGREAAALRRMLTLHAHPQGLLVPSSFRQAQEQLNIDPGTCALGSPGTVWAQGTPSPNAPPSQMRLRRALSKCALVLASPHAARSEGWSLPAP